MGGCAIIPLTNSWTDPNQSLGLPVQVFIVATAILCFWIAFRIVRAGYVRFDATSITVRGTFRDRTIPRGDITHVAIGPSSGAGYARVAPHLGLKSGKELTLSEFASPKSSYERHPDTSSAGIAVNALRSGLGLQAAEDSGH